MMMEKIPITIPFGILLFAFFIFNRYQLNKKQKTQIEEKNRLITDSIEYAKEIQQAILPQQQLLQDHFPGSFILFVCFAMILSSLWEHFVLGVVDFAWRRKFRSSSRFLRLHNGKAGFPGSCRSLCCRRCRGATTWPGA